MPSFFVSLRLIDHGGAATLNTHHMILGTPMMVLGANPDADPAAVDLLHHAGGSVSLLETKGKMLPAIKYFFRPMMRVQRVFGSVGARGFLRLFAKISDGGIHPKGTTAVHVAAQKGHVAMVKAMAEVTDDKLLLRSRDDFGLTPLARARHTAAGVYDVALEPVLGTDPKAPADGARAKKAPASGQFVSVTPPAQVAPKA